MGNLCSKSDSENFAQPGRVLGTAPEQPSRSSVPASAGVARVGGPPRTLGGAAPPPAASASPGGGNDNQDARKRAAEAAEVSHGRDFSSSSSSAPISLPPYKGRPCMSCL